VNGALGLIEVNGWSPAMMVLDAMEKAAWIRLVQAELNDQPGVILKIEGPVADVTAAIRVGGEMAASMKARWVSDVIPNPDGKSERAWLAKPEFNPLFEQDVVHEPRAQKKEKALSQNTGFAVGLIETQGFTAIFEAIDTACKTADVEVLAREKLGGGYITVVIKGDVAAVRAAVEAGRAKAEGLGKLIAAHVIPNPSEGVLRLLPK
jgi:carbon dioxide concentrating mechanism protein CcmO